MHFFSSEKVDDLFLVVALKHRLPKPFHHRQNESNKAVIYGNIFIYCLHYHRSKAIRRDRQGGARAVDLPARSFDLARPGVAPSLSASMLNGTTEYLAYLRDVKPAVACQYNSIGA